MFGTRVQQFFRRMVERVMRPLAHLGITPNMLTITGFMLTAFTAGVIAFNHLRIGGLLVLVSGIFDMFDGAMARVTQKSSKFGAFFDSTLDRYSEGILLLGVIIYAQLHLPQQTIVIGTITTAQLVVWLAYLVALSSLMVSYTRARAEGLGLECKVGLLARPERVILLAIGLLIGQVALLWTMLVLALLTTLTAIQRIIHIWAITRPPTSQPTTVEDAPSTRAASAPAPGSEPKVGPLTDIAKRLKREQPIEG
jgi:CDP-diacylglycerol--glycerol-3-phosphate 3-phosphatidyltransferase